MLEIFAECLHGVEIVLAQRERARGGRSPRIHEGHLDNIEVLAGIAHK